MNPECNCSSDPRYLVRPTFRASRWHKARVPHKCCECGGPIVEGGRYEYVFGVWDGEPAAFHTCPPCVTIRDHYCPDGYEIGALATTLFECLGFDYREPDPDS